MGLRIDDKDGMGAGGGLIRAGCGNCSAFVADLNHLLQVIRTIHDEFLEARHEDSFLRVLDYLQILLLGLLHRISQ